MRGARLAVLAAVVVVLGAFILLYERHRPTTDQNREQAERIFPSLERDTVAAVEIRNAHGRVRLEREDDDWALVEPVHFPADSSKVQSLLDALVNLNAERTLASNEVDPAAYGLDPPLVEVELEDRQGNRRRLKVGNETALGASRAVSIDPSQVKLCASWFASDLERDVDHWRSRQVADVFVDQVASVELESSSGRVHAVQVDERWTLLEPLHDLADRDKLQTLLADLNGQRVEEFVVGAQDPSVLGLSPPAHRVTLVRNDGRQPLVLELGATRERDGTTQVACRRNGMDLMWITDRALTALGRAPVLWRSTTVYPFEAWDVEGLTITSGTTSVALRREGGQWQGQGDAEVDSRAVTERLSALAQLEAVDFDLIEPGSGESGRVEMLLSAAAEDGEPTPVRFTFYPPVAPGGRAVVRVSARDTVMSVDPAAVETILDLETLRPSPTTKGPAAEE